MSLQADLKDVCVRHLAAYRVGGEAKLREVVGNLADVQSADALIEIFDHQSCVVREAADALANDKQHLYPWTLIPLAAVGFGSAFASIVWFWARTEMDCEDEDEKRKAQKKVDRRIDRTVWAYCLTVGKP